MRGSLISAILCQRQVVKGRIMAQDGQPWRGLRLSASCSMVGLIEIGTALVDETGEDARIGALTQRPGRTVCQVHGPLGVEQRARSEGDGGIAPQVLGEDCGIRIGACERRADELLLAMLARQSVQCAQRGHLLECAHHLEVCDDRRWQDRHHRSGGLGRTDVVGMQGFRQRAAAKGIQGADEGEVVIDALADGMSTRGIGQRTREEGRGCGGGARQLHAELAITVHGEGEAAAGSRQRLLAQHVAQDHVARLLAQRCIPSVGPATVTRGIEHHLPDQFPAQEAQHPILAELMLFEIHRRCGGVMGGCRWILGEHEGAWRQSA